VTVASSHNQLLVNNNNLYTVLLVCMRDSPILLHTQEIFQQHECCQMRKYMSSQLVLILQFSNALATFKDLRTSVCQGPWDCFCYDMSTAVMLGSYPPPPVHVYPFCRHAYISSHTICASTYCGAITNSFKFWHAVQCTLYCRH